MSDPREIMGMLTCHGIEIGRPFGGIPKLTALDVAGAVGMGMDPSSAALLLAKYAHDGQQYAECRTYWFVKVMTRKAKKGWTTDRPGLLKGLADVTLEEHVGHNVCRRCKGPGTVMDGQKVIDCETCEGTGRRYYRPSAICRGIGIKPQSYNQLWRERVEWCRGELSRWEIDAAEDLRRALRG